MPEDLTITETPEKDEEDALFEFTSPVDDIASAFNALSAVGEMDAGLMSKSQAAMVNRIKRKSLRIIDFQIGYLYDCLFEEKKDDDEE